MALRIPLRSDLPWYSLSVELEGVSYGLEFKWNTVSEAWYVSFYDASGVPTVSGKRVVLNWPIVSRYANPSLPPGVLIFVDTTGKDLEAGREDLGGRVELQYFTEAEAYG